MRPGTFIYIYYMHGMGMNVVCVCTHSLKRHETGPVVLILLISQESQRDVHSRPFSKWRIAFWGGVYVWGVCVCMWIIRVLCVCDCWLFFGWDFLLVCVRKIVLMCEECLYGKYNNNIFLLGSNVVYYLFLKSLRLW